MTITEKILASAAGLDKVAPGQYITARVDKVIGHDISLAAFRELERMGAERVFDPERVAVTCDHFVPSPTVEAAEQYKGLAYYVNRYGIKHFFEPGRGGVCHALFPEQGLILPGELVVGSDSHTCTYGALGAVAVGVGSSDAAAAMALGEIWLKVPASIKVEFVGAVPPWVFGKDLVLAALGKLGVNGAVYKAVEFVGEALRHLSMDERFTICNMAVEAGCKNAIMIPDEVTAAYLGPNAHGGRIYTSDPDAEYVAHYRIDCSQLTPQVACPSLPDKVCSVRDLSGIRIDQGVIGSCTNGRISDLRVAAEVLRGRRVRKGVRLLIIPATQRTYLMAVREGLIDVFLEAGAVVCPPTCGPCFGGHMGLLASGEVAISSTNRNFSGRMGAPGAQIYLASPATVAASAVQGEIVDPREVAGNCSTGR